MSILRNAIVQWNVPGILCKSRSFLQIGLSLNVYFHGFLPSSPPSPRGNIVQRTPRKGITHFVINDSRAGRALLEGSRFRRSHLIGNMPQKQHPRDRQALVFYERRIRPCLLLFSGSNSRVRALSCLRSARFVQWHGSLLPLIKYETLCLSGISVVQHGLPCSKYKRKESARVTKGKSGNIYDRLSASARGKSPRSSFILLSLGFCSVPMLVTRR